MNRELLLLRHGKSRWDTDQDDFDRPLKDRGKRAAQRIGNWLLQNDRVPDLIISSPATRAIETARKACKVMDIPAKSIRREDALYNADVAQLTQVIASIPKDRKRVLLVGHNPGLEQLLLYLAQGPVERPDDGKLLPTATLAILDITRAWSDLQEAAAKLHDIIRPRDLPKKFPWPARNGSELRDRPAYYYQQSSVIPYRIQDGRIEILIIRSSQNKHWVVPKGIVDPGLSPQDSAAKEAMEEAGVKGVVGMESLGAYEYEKWGARCTVSVYPMKVTDIIPESEWEERHRGRIWVRPDEAMTQLWQEKLYPMIETLSDISEHGDDA